MYPLYVSWSQLSSEQKMVGQIFSKFLYPEKKQKDCTLTGVLIISYYNQKGFALKTLMHKIKYSPMP